MKILTTASLVRGATLVDYAYSNGGRSLELDVADYVGIVAAYLGRGKFAVDMQTELGKRLTPAIANNAFATFKLFSVWHNRGLWNQGAAVDDICFTNKTLRKRYPQVNIAHTSLMEACNRGDFNDDSPF